MQTSQQWTDKYIPNSGSFPDYEIRRRRMLILTAFLTSFFAFQNTIISYSVDYFTGAWSTCLWGVIYFAIPFASKRGIPNDWLAHIYVGLTYSLNVLLFWDGGGFAGVATPYMTMVPLLAILLINRRAGLFWLVMACLAFAGLGSMQLMGVEFVIPYSERVDAWFKISAYIGLLIIIFFVTKTFDLARERAMEVVEDKNLQLDKSRKVSDDLLLNILPQQTATELKETGKATTRAFDNVTIMFADFIAFTQIAERLPPVELVELIDEYFSAFDNIMAEFDLEKIKTIGDAYMVASGLPHLSDDHAQRTVLAAKKMCEFVAKREQDLDREHFLIRIGIHSGPVIAGVVGSKKFAYDIWGDSVNVAARMQGSGASGKINISGATYQLIKGEFNCTYRGKVEAKHKGEVDMYFVD